MTDLTTATSDSIEHVAFPSITRWNRLTIASEKIHGANFGIHVLPDDTVHAQSRKKLITLQSDVNGFARWVAEHADELREQLGYGLHFGEFWGLGVQKRFYTNMTEKRFSLFNTGQWNSEFNQQVMSGTDPDEATGSTQCIEAPLCHVVPVLAVGMSPWSPEIMGAIDKLKAHGSYAAPGWMRPEGVVLFHSPSSSLFKVLCENDETHKSLIGD